MFVIETHGSNFPSPHGGEGGAHCGKQWEGAGDQVSKLFHLIPLILPRLRRGPLLLPHGEKEIALALFR
jgi:hypothetical protein